MTARTALASKPLGALSLALLLCGAASAQTPDAMTPAEEDVCDVLHDATPGLYGLCVAYCEAQDCDSVDRALSGQCQAPSPRLLDLFDRKRRADDPAMPCLGDPEPVCSCFDLEDLAAIEIDVCIAFDPGYDVVVIMDDTERYGAVSERGEGWGTCTLVSNTGSVVFEIDEEEAFACETLIRYRALESGLSCD